MSKLIDCKLVLAMVFSIVFSLFALSNTAFSADTLFKAAEPVEFNSTPYTYSPTPFAIKRAKKLGVETEVKTEPAIALAGYLAKPESDGIHPAVVLLHTCAGISEHEESWSVRLVRWGYVVLTVDSLGSRGKKYICDGSGGQSTSPWIRALDAYGAKKYLSTHPMVDPDRIAVVGLSHGAMAILEIIKRSNSVNMPVSQFRAAIAYYPTCGEPYPIDVPTLIIIGGKDTWTPAVQCEHYRDKMPEPNTLYLQVLPDAYHLFDHPGINMKELGHTIRSNANAAAKAYHRTRSFLEEQL